MASLLSLECWLNTMLGKHCISLPSFFSPVSPFPSACEVGGVGNVVLLYRV